ncbi:PAS domain-containing protein [Streptomyces albidochromogenes]|uniref:PAS domain-containing protein n=1 Tax=Streptomyces albidochromogenes TaxID=329524 RepID=A0ABW6FIS8_9ACTN
MPSPQQPDAEGTPAEGGGPDARGVFTRSAVGLHVPDRGLRVARINTLAAGMRGVAPEQVIGLPTSEAYTPFAKDVDERALREVLETGYPRRHISSGAEASLPPSA